MKTLKEELGRNIQSVDQVGNLSWKDFEGINVETIADTANNLWTVTVECSDYPEFSIPQRSFADEESANFFAREQSERIRNQRMNLKEVRILVKKIILSL